MCTMETWLAQFFAAVDAARRGEAPAPSMRTPARREREIESAGRRLAEAGIGA